MTWNPALYLTWGDERGRPFHDLVGRIDASAPATVVDLGCGPGNLTSTLAQRWPGAEVLGLDSSPEMIEAARAADPGQTVTWQVEDVQTFARTAEPGSVDVLVSNATLQWVPEHLALLPALLDAVRPGGWFAWQVPGNFDEPSHTLLGELSADARWADQLVGVHRPAAPSAPTYLQLVRGLDDRAGGGRYRVDAWETTYLHVLTGQDPVFTWVSATGARTTLEALDPESRGAFEDQYKALLREAYPPGADGSVVLPFRRSFVVVQKSEGGAA